MYQSIILGCILVATLYILRRPRNSKLNMPPLVRYKIPIIGHTFIYLSNCEEFLGQCRKEVGINQIFRTWYGDIFSLYIWGKVITFIGKEHLHEIFAKDDVFDFGAVFKRIIPGDSMFTKLDRFVLIKHIKNQVDKRLHEKQKYGDSWKRPNDLLQDFMEEESFDQNNINYVTIAEKICMFIFVSIITTSRSCANAIIDLASRPECMQELYEEQLEIRKKADENGILPIEAFDEMKKLDSFVKESLRLTGDIAALPHMVLEDYTFSNGLQVPKDHVVNLYFYDVVQDEVSQGPNPKSFEPWRHVNTNAPASKVSKIYVPFGGGKRACPGRFFAVDEIKYVLHTAILKYNFRTESGKIEEKRRMGPITFPSSCGVIFEKRI